MIILSNLLKINATRLAIRRRCGIVVIVSSQSAYHGLLQTAYQTKFYLRVDKQHIMLTDIIA